MPAVEQQAKDFKLGLRKRLKGSKTAPFRRPIVCQERMRGEFGFPDRETVVGYLVVKDGVVESAGLGVLMAGGACRDKPD